MYKLLIDSEEIDLQKDTRIQLSLLILDLKDISNRGITITNNINLPFTAKNNRVLGYPLGLDNDTQGFEIKKTYSLYNDGVLHSEGSILVKSCDKIKGIKIQLAEGLGFWDKVGGRMLNYLNFQDENITLTSSNLSAIKTKTSSPLLQGYSRSRDDISFGEYVYNRPAYRFKRLFDEIVSQAGYFLNWTNTLSVTGIDNLGVMSNAQKLNFQTLGREAKNLTIPTGKIPISAMLNIASTPIDINLSGDDIDNSNYKHSLHIKGLIKSQINGFISVAYTKAGEEKIESFYLSKGLNEYNFTSSPIESGTLISIYTSIPIIFVDTYLICTVSESDFFEVEGTTFLNTINPIMVNKFISLDYSLPGMTQKDLIKFLIKAFFLKVDVNEITKEVKVSHFPDILSTNNALDISDKVVKDGEIMSGDLYAQLNTMTYSNDKDIPEGEGNFSFNIDNESARPSKNFISAPEFSASKEVVYDGRQVVALDIYSATKRIVLKDRIVYFDGEDGNYNFRMSGASWNNFYSDSYQSFIEATSRERAVKKKALLTYLDFLRIKDNPVVYIKEYNSNFIVTEIEGFEKGQLTDLTLLKFS